MNEIVNYQAEMAADAARYAENEASGGKFLSTSNGILKINDQKLPGNQIVCVVLDSIFQYTYYTDNYDADNIVSPKCFAFGLGASDMAPHPAVDGHDYFERQADNCAACAHSKFFSAKIGKGKACKDRRRLAIIPAGFYKPNKAPGDYELHLFEEESHYRNTDIVFLQVPPSSLTKWGQYVRQGSAVNLPPYGFVTRIYLEPDPKNQFSMNFEIIEEIPREMLGLIRARHKEASGIIAQPYSPPQ